MKLLLFKIPIAIISAVLVLIGVGFIAFEIGLIERPTIAVGDSDWGSVSRQQTTIRTDVEVTNPNEFGVTLDDVELGVLVDLNDIRVAEGRTQRLPLPAGHSTTTVVTVVDNTTIPGWWASHVENGERTEAVITPAVHSIAFGRSLVVDTLEETREFETNVLAPASSQQPESFPIGPYSLTVKSRTFHWGHVSDNKAVIEGEIVLYQDSPIDINAASVEFSFAMNDIQVAQGGIGGPIELPSGVDTPVHFTAEFVNDRLLDWWPTHVEAGEETRYRVQTAVAVDTPVGTARATVLNVQDRFTTNLLRTFQDQIGVP